MLLFNDICEKKADLFWCVDEQKLEWLFDWNVFKLFDSILKGSCLVLFLIVSSMYFILQSTLPITSGQGANRAAAFNCIQSFPHILGALYIVCCPLQIK